MGGSGSFASRSRRLQEQASRPSAKAGSPQTLGDIAHKDEA